MLTGVIFGAIVIAWIAYLVPYLLSRRDHVGHIDQETLDQFADSMQVVRRSGQAAPGFLTDSGAQVSTPMTRRAAQHHLREASLIATRRRRLGMIVHLLLVVVGVALPFVLPVAHWWTALPVGLLFCWVVLSRISVVTVNRMLDAERAEIGFGDEEPTIVIGGPVQDGAGVTSVGTERSIEITGPIGETLGSLWNPIPVTPTTYVSRPLLPRSVRTIDLSAPVASSELRLPVTADRPRPGPIEASGSDLPRAVGE